MSFGMKKRLCLLLIGFLLLFAVFPFFLGKKQQPEGEYITKEEVLLLNDLLKEILDNNSLNNLPDSKEVLAQQKVIFELEDVISNWPAEEYVTYKQFREWEEKASREFQILSEEEKNIFSDKYKKSFFITKKDWFLAFGSILEETDLKDEVKEEELLVLGDLSNVVDVEGKPIEENMVYTQNGKWEKRLADKFIPNQQKGLYITYQGALWGVYNVEPAATLLNVWIVENTDESFEYFYKNYKVTTTKNEILESMEREQVADLYFVLGDLRDMGVKTEKITGKVLKISSEEVEIEGLGVYSLSENIQYYRLYDRLESVGRSEVRLGYTFTDFVIEEGVVQAALLVKDEKMENIRVLIKNSDFDGYYHQEIITKANVDLELLYGKEKIEIPTGETFTIYPDSDYFVTNRVYLKPKALTGRTIFTNIERNNGGQGYYGVFELEKRDEGILLINEVLLEEYLYAVVPSEMPGYYPLEALKAQAISARTYAYNKMLSSGLASFGANLDDSATYQVYNNIKENPNTTTAVKETRGELLYTPNGTAETYYYSTSCGFGTDAAIWNVNNVNTLSYLQAKEMTTEENTYTAEELQTEEGFLDFINKVDKSHFEAEEGWYRWSYHHKNIEKIKEKVMIRLENYPNYTYTSIDGENWGNSPLEEDFVITDIQVKHRGAGGTIEELLITTDKGYFLIKNEYHIRAVIADGEAKANLQNGNTYACGNLLPSAFFSIDTEKDDERLTGIKIIGGGFGHGVGMSQNGAKNLANLGYEAEEILEFYYEGCQVQE